MDSAWSGLRGVARTIAFNLPVFKHIYRTRYTSGPITFWGWFIQKVIGVNRAAYWPVHPTSRVSNPRMITIGIGAAPGIMPGCYIQGYGRIRIGDYTILAPNVGLISSNHDPADISTHIRSSIDLGAYCWIGMNATIMPGVVLGDHTVVGANSVVTRSFPEGYVVLGGVPAKVIARIDPARCRNFRFEYEYRGFVPEARFQKRRNRYVDE